MRTPHTTFTKGKHVFCILRDGEKFDDYWEGKNWKFVILRNRGEVAIKNIRSLGFYKQQEEV